MSRALEGGSVGLPRAGPIPASAARGADRSAPVETYAWGSDARGTRAPQDDPAVRARTRRVAQRAHAGVGGCREEASPLVQGRVGRCPTGSKSRAASRLKRRWQQPMPRPDVPPRTRERHDFFAEKLAGQQGAGDGTRRNALRRECSKRAQMGLNCLSLHGSGQHPERAAPSFDGGCCSMSIDMEHVGMQRITAARSVEARFLWKRFCRSRNDARP